MLEMTDIILVVSLDCDACDGDGGLNHDGALDTYTPCVPLSRTRIRHTLLPSPSLLSCTALRGLSSPHSLSVHISDEVSWGRRVRSRGYLRYSLSGIDIEYEHIGKIIS